MTLPFQAFSIPPDAALVKLRLSTPASALVTPQHGRREHTREDAVGAHAEDHDRIADGVVCNLSPA